MTEASSDGLRYDFPLDRFQLEAIQHLREGRSVLVAAPTGSGKTVVADFAVHDALTSGRRAFYTTPIKALSNQKFRDLAAVHGAANVGLLTGDNSINGDAPIVVMTTEVLRNMIYAQSRALDALRYVVLDEVHYLQDAYRGPVWEEVIVHLSPAVRLVCLSATVSNAVELAEWIETARGPTAVVVEDQRPIELVNLFMAGDKTSERLHLLPTLLGGRANPEGQRFDAVLRPLPRDRGGSRPRRPYFTPSRVEVVERLQLDELTPAIYFIFSRAACDDAVRACVAAGLRLTDRDERARIRTIVEERTASLTDSDLDVLRYDEWLTGLELGIASHHAGMVPPFKETVELLFTQGLVKLVFATETLALGINMPARSVVIEKLTKFTGDHHEFLTPGEYTQLTGRAGRRGIDRVGHAIVLWSPFTTFQQVADLAASRSFVLRSAFRPTYNMAANLVRRYEPDLAHHLLNRSFAQFQTDRALVRMEQRLAQRRRDIDALVDQLGGDRNEIERLRRDADAPLRSSRREVTDAMAQLKPGDVVALPETGERAAVVSVAQRAGGAVRVRVVTAGAHVEAIGSSELDLPLAVLGSIELPVPFAPNSKPFQHDVADVLRHARLSSNGEPSPRRTRRARNDPQARRRARMLEQLARAEREVHDIERRIDARTDSLGRRFDDVLGVLEEWGYVDGWSLTPKGLQLVRVFHECDLLIAECLSQGLFDGLDVASVAGLASLFVYEHRSPNPPPAPWFSSRDVRKRAETIDGIALAINRAENAARLTPTRRPDPTFFALAHAWAAGNTLEQVLEDEDLSGGDFVRTTKMLIDLLRQLGDAALSPDTSRVARAAAEAIERGVVAASGSVTTAAAPDEPDLDEPDDPTPNTSTTAGPAAGDAR